MPRTVVDCIWNVMAHVQKPDFVFRQNGQVHLNRRGRQFSWLLAAEMRAWPVVMLDTPCFEAVWGVLATHSIRQFPLHFPSRVSLCAITFQLDSTNISVFCRKPSSTAMCKMQAVGFPKTLILFFNSTVTLIYTTTRMSNLTQVMQNFNVLKLTLLTYLAQINI